jgi:hypothetical protein
MSQRTATLSTLCGGLRRQFLDQLRAAHAPFRSQLNRLDLFLVHLLHLDEKDWLGSLGKAAVPVSVPPPYANLPRQQSDGTRAPVSQWELIA